MDKSMIIGLVVGAAATTTFLAGIAGYEISHRPPAYAEVIKADPVIHTVKDTAPSLQGRTR